MTMNKRAVAKELVRVAKELVVANRQKYKGYTIEKSGMNFYVTDPSGHRAFAEVPASVETAKKWIDVDIREKGTKVASGEEHSGGLVMERNEIAEALVEVAKLLTGSDTSRTAAANDLATILELIPAMEEKRAERIRKQEEYQRETNRMYSEEMKDISERSVLLLDELKEAIMGYFHKNGMGVSRTDWQSNMFGGEIFIGSGDGVKRSDSKVVVHLSIGVGESLGHRERDAYFFFRNDADEIDDQKFVLSEKNTVKELIKFIAKFDKKGYWKVPVEE
jgi:hypothetical protein